MQDLKDAPSVAELLRRFSRLTDMPEEALAYAVGVHPGTITKWKEALLEERPIRVNNATRAAIADLLALENGTDAKLEGMERVLRHFRASLEKMEAAAAVRRALATSPPEGAEPGHIHDAEDVRKVAEEKARYAAPKRARKSNRQ